MSGFNGSRNFSEDGSRCFSGVCNDRSLSSGVGDSRTLRIRVE